MKEKIKELALECYNPYSNFDHEKFAELIVRECMEVCADRGKHHDGLYSAWASDCSERIGKRFGVEK
jgi:hypothetical protein